MWKTNGKTTTLVPFLDSLFPKIEEMCEILQLEINILEVNYYPIRISEGGGGGSVSSGNNTQYSLQEDREGPTPI
jgi:hypothetical protein